MILTPEMLAAEHAEAKAHYDARPRHSMLPRETLPKSTSREQHREALLDFFDDLTFLTMAGVKDVDLAVLGAYHGARIHNPELVHPYAADIDAVIAKYKAQP